MKVAYEEGACGTDQDMTDDSQSFYGMGRRGHGHPDMGFGGYPPFMGPQGPNPYMMGGYNPYAWNPYNYDQWGYGWMSPGGYGGHYGEPFQGPFSPMGPFRGRHGHGHGHGPWKKRGKWWRQFMNMENEDDSGSSGGEDVEEVIEIPDEEDAPVEINAEMAAMETEGEEQAKDGDNTEKKGKKENKEKNEKKGQGRGGPGPRIMAAYWAGRLGLPIPEGPRGRPGKCGGKMKGHGHPKCDKMKKIMKKMNKHGWCESAAEFPPGPPPPHGPPPPFGPPGHGPPPPPGFGGPGIGPMGPRGMGPNWMGHHGMGHHGFGGPMGGGCGRGWRRRQMLREACRQFMERKQGRCDPGKDGDCPEKRQEKPSEGPADKEKNTTGAQESTTGKKDKSAEGRPWDRWAAWEQSLQQIYGGDEIAQDGFGESEDDLPPPPPMWQYGWGGRGFGRRHGHGPGHHGHGPGHGHGHGHGRWRRRMMNAGFMPEFDDAEINQGAPGDVTTSGDTDGQPSQPEKEKN